MAGQWAPEVGHPNYQHPQRAAEHFDASLDDFSSWVIYVSLVALAYAPGLWSRFDGGDECLFLRKKDFLHPESSGAIGAMRAAISEPKFQEMLDAFIWILGRDPDGVLPLPPIGRPRPGTADHPASDPGADGPGGMPDWMENERQGNGGDGGPSVPGDPLAGIKIRDAGLPGFGAAIIHELEQAGRRVRVRADVEEIYVPDVGDHRAAQLQAGRGGLAGLPPSSSEESVGDTSVSSPAVAPPAPAAGGADPVAVAGTAGSHYNPVASPPSAKATHTSPVWEKWMVVIVVLAVCCVIAVVIMELFVLYSIMNLL
jgi:hypothetical protein